MKIPLFLFLFSAVLSSYGQDTMYMMNGDTMNVKVTEVTETEVRYKLQSNPNGPAYVIAKTKIFMVEYENGSKDVFARENASTPSPAIADPVMSQRRAELEALHRRKLGGGIAGVIIGSLGTAVAGSAFAFSLASDLESSSRVEAATGAYGFGTMVSIVVLWSGIEAIVKAGTIRRELNGLPVAITPALLAPQGVASAGLVRQGVYGISLTYTF